MLHATKHFKRKLQGFGISLDASSSSSSFLSHVVAVHYHTGDHLKRPPRYKKKSEQKKHLRFDSRHKNTALLRSIMQAVHKEQVDIFIRHFLLPTTQQKI